MHKTLCPVLYIYIYIIGLSTKYLQLQCRANECVRSPARDGQLRRGEFGTGLMGTYAYDNQYYIIWTPD